LITWCTYIFSPTKMAYNSKSISVEMHTFVFVFKEKKNLLIKYDNCND